MSFHVKLLIFLAALLAPCIVSAQCTGASPTWSSTPDQASVSTCVTNAVNGDTINVTAGTGSAVWTAGIAITNKYLSIIGPGSANLTINDGIATNATPCEMFNIKENSVGNTMRLSGFTIQPNSGVTAACPPIRVLGTCTASGCPNIRIDNNVFSGWQPVNKAPNSYGITAIGNMFGVLDHNTVNGVTSGYLQLVEFAHASYLGTGLDGDNSAAAASSWGTANNLFIENNTFNSAGCCESESSPGGFDDLGGGRLVLRFNTFNNMGLGAAYQDHGTESANRRRRPTWVEIYANTFTCAVNQFCTYAFFSRGPNVMLHDDSVNKGATGSGLNHDFQLIYYRARASFSPWGVCDGSSPYDVNDGGATPTIYATGTASASSTTDNLVDSGSPNWTANQWSPNGAPYSLRNLTKGWGSEINSNTANSIATADGAGFATHSWASGDSYEIRRATVCIDQEARGPGQLYSGATPTPVAATTQPLQPMYSWGETLNTTTSFGDYSGTNRIIRNRDFYIENHNQAVQSSQTSPFDGTTTIGMGRGTLANRPTTCTTGVGYTATDQGNWNTNNTAIPGQTYTQGRLYTCTSTNTWTLTYTPYTYPHPLVSGAGVVSVSPASLSFGTITRNTSSSAQTVTLTNNSSTTATLTGETITGTNAADFTRSSDTCNSGTVATGGATCSVNITFTPTAAPGTNETATLNIPYTGPTGSPQTVSLSGTSGAAPSNNPIAPAPAASTLNFTPNATRGFTCTFPCTVTLTCLLCKTGATALVTAQ